MIWNAVSSLGGLNEEGLIGGRSRVKPIQPDGRSALTAAFSSLKTSMVAPALRSISATFPKRSDSI
jgi:hypothetical protein